MRKFVNTTKGYEFSGRRAICPTHGFQKDVKTDFASHRKDFAGMNTDYGCFCLLCGALCENERADEIEVCPHHRDNELMSDGTCDLCVEEEYSNPFHDYGGDSQ